MTNYYLMFGLPGGIAIGWGIAAALMGHWRRVLISETTGIILVTLYFIMESL